jgi:hypothetical protein
MVASISDPEGQSGVIHVFFIRRPCTTFLVAMRLSLAYLDYMWGHLITIIYTILPVHRSVCCDTIQAFRSFFMKNRLTSLCYSTAFLSPTALVL